MVNDAVFCIYEIKFKKIFISQMMIILLRLVEYPASNRSIITNTTSKVYQIKAIQKPSPSNQLQMYTFLLCNIYIYIYICIYMCILKINLVFDPIPHYLYSICRLVFLLCLKLDLVVFLRLTIN